MHSFNSYYQSFLSFYTNDTNIKLSSNYDILLSLFIDVKLINSFNKSS